MDAEAAIHEIVDRETRACNTKDVPLLLSVFHPDMVWAWPATYTSYDPFEWCLVLGKFDPERWRSVYEELFETRTLVHNRRETVRIKISAQGDGAFAVVDIDASPRRRRTSTARTFPSGTSRCFRPTRTISTATTKASAARREDTFELPARTARP